MTESQENIHDFNDLDVSSEIDPEGRPTASDEQDALKSALAQKADESKAWQEKYLRLAAEMENYKRLSQREQRDSIRFGNESILKEILPAIDNLERAIKAAKDAGAADALIQGVELTLKQLLEGLAKFGVQQLQCQGQPFDPAHHQAVTQVDSASIEPGHIVDEFQKGYLLHERVLRAAMVSVASAQASQDS